MNSPGEKTIYRKEGKKRTMAQCCPKCRGKKISMSTEVRKINKKEETAHFIYCFNCMTHYSVENLL